jgi:hypothetical protein
LADCEDTTVQCFAMTDFVKGREDTSVTTLFQTFVPCVVGKKKFKAKMHEQLTTDADICSVSDEAFTLLLLENQYDRWSDIYQQRKNKSKEGSVVRQERRKRKWESDISPKYTDGGIRYSDDRKMTHKGWKEAGIVRFNELCAKVHGDRKLYPKKVVEPLLKWWSQIHHVTKQKVKDVDDVVAGTSAYHELWDDEPEPPIEDSPGTDDTTIVGQVSL